MKKNNFGLEFGKHAVRDWEKIAEQELGSNPWEKLTKENSGIQIKPYYDSSNAVTENKVLISQTDRNWINASRISVTNEKTANTEALKHLNSGADGIFFELKSNSINFNELLKDIELKFCSVFFSGEDNSVSCLNAFTDM